MTAREWSPWRGVLAFVPMCALAALSWAELLVGPPAGRVAALVAIAAGCGLVLALSGRLEPGGRNAARIVRVVTVVMALVLGALAAGIAPELLSPGGWDQLVAGLSRGVDGLPHEWPYSGGDPWVRRTVLLAIPVMTVPAAAFALSPPASGPGGPEAAAVRRVGALLLLISLIGFAGSERELADPIGRGALLLAALVAWLFLPRLPAGRPGRALAAGAVVLVAGLAALPLGALGVERMRTQAQAEQPREAPARARAGGRARAERSPARRERSGRSERSGESERRGRSERRGESERRSRSERSRGSERSGGRGGSGGTRRDAPARPEPSPGGGSDERSPLAAIVLIVAVLAIGAYALRRRLRRGGRPGDEAEQLRRLLERLGWSVPPQTTLAALERDLAAGAGPDAARYARGLRERRFGGPGSRATATLDRDALRRDLTAGQGPRARLIGLLALPPAALDLRR